MKYLSVFSGIEAASVAWEPLGWTPVGFSEIEPFASAVLAARFPETINYGDITQHESWSGIVRGSVDLLVGGSPCQAFSVAGLRKGLEDPRGQLSLVYLQLAARIRPRWIVWENVPGVLSADGGRAFGAFLGALVELGYGFAWRVLDAKHFGVPQRRRRVFLVARDSGDWKSCAEVLLEPAGLPWNHPTSGSPWKNFASNAAHGVGAGGKWWDGSDQSASMTTRCHDQFMPDKGNFAAIVQPTIGALDTHCGGTGRKHQSCCQGHFIPAVRSFTGTSHAQYAEGVGTLRASGGDLGGGSETIVSIQGNLIGRETGGPQGVGVSVNEPMYTLTKADVHAVAIRTANTNANGHGVAENVTHTLDGAQGQAIAHAFYSTGGTHGLETHSEISPPLKVGTTLGIPSGVAVAHTINTHAVCIALDEELNPTVNIAGTVTRGGDGGRHAAVCISVDDQCNARPNQNNPLRAHGSSEAFVCVSPTLTASNDPSRSPQSSEVTAQIASVVQATNGMIVRRLTPVECERLQGFPDNWTLVPYRGKPASDGPRYKALGNSMAVPCMAWIGARIAMVEANRGSA